MENVSIATSLKYFFFQGVRNLAAHHNIAFTSLAHKNNFGFMVTLMHSIQVEQIRCVNC